MPLHPHARHARIPTHVLSVIDRLDCTALRVFAVIGESEASA